MKTNRALLFISSLLLSTSLLKAEIKETVVDYQSGDVLCEGLHVVDTAKTGKLPSILIIHQWTGLSDNEKMRAHMLAELGYNVFCADIYGKGVRPQPPRRPKEAGSTRQTASCTASACCLPWSCRARTRTRMCPRSRRSATALAARG